MFLGCRPEIDPDQARVVPQVFDVMSAGWLSSELSERLPRPVDVVLLETCRFRHKIEREGEW
jgi:hypothetical protein